VLLIIVTSIVGIARSGEIESVYSSVGCSIAITLDDIINGNISSSNQYFIGLKALANDMANLKGNITNANNQLKLLSLSNTSSILSQTYLAGTNLLLLLSQVPNGTAGQVMGTYYYPTMGATAITTFPPLLGSANQTVTARKGAMNSSYTEIYNLN
jgi:hypothetical protein